VRRSAGRSSPTSKRSSKIGRNGGFRLAGHVGGGLLSARSRDDCGIRVGGDVRGVTAGGGSACPRADIRRGYGRRGGNRRSNGASGWTTSPLEPKAPSAASRARDRDSSPLIAPSR
jgi:hypothetical protein